MFALLLRFAIENAHQRVPTVSGGGGRGGSHLGPSIITGRDQEPTLTAEIIGRTRRRGRVILIRIRSRIFFRSASFSHAQIGDDCDTVAGQRRTIGGVASDCFECRDDCVDGHEIFRSDWQVGSSSFSIRCGFFFPFFFSCWYLRDN